MSLLISRITEIIQYNLHSANDTVAEAGRMSVDGEETGCGKGIEDERQIGGGKGIEDEKGIDDED